jgi:hypothetical protein
VDSDWNGYCDLSEDTLKGCGDYRRPFLCTGVDLVKRTDLNYIVDVAMVAFFLLSFITGLIKFPAVLVYVLQVYGALPMYKINWLHDHSGLAFGTLGVIHIVLHWDWLVAMTRRKLSTTKRETVKQSDQ